MSNKHAFVQGLTEYSQTQKDDLGDIRWVGNKCYKYVQYDDGAGALDLAEGDALFYTDDSGYGANQVQCDVSGLSGTPIPAGCALMTVDTSAQSDSNGQGYMWIQIKGPITAAVALASSDDASPVACGDGDPITIDVSTDKAFRRCDTVHNNDAGLVGVAGIAVDASAKEILLDCPF